MMRFLIVLWCLLCLVGSARAQQGRLLPDKLAEEIKGLSHITEVKLFYQIYNERWAWVDHPDRQSWLCDLLHSCNYLGLNERDYQYAFLKTFWSHQLPLSDTEDSLEADVRITDAAIHFLCDLQLGNLSPDLKYEGLKRQPDYESVVRLLCLRLQQDSLSKMVGEVQPHSTAYTNALLLLRHFAQVTSDTAFREVVITSSKPVLENRPLCYKLYQLGMLDSVNQLLKNSQLLERVKKAQSMLGVLNDGVLRSTTLAAFNISIWRRKLELERCINYIRWLTPLQNQAPIALVNIPSASLLVFDREGVLLQSKLIVGKIDTPTPTLSSIITELVLYPYWMVPYKIATRELLPSIQRNIQFLDLGGFQVVNKRGEVLDPYSINWQALSYRNFPYILRQSTGCDNALGIVKFNFVNPFSVYLHDTPTKNLFLMNIRYFSHGCIRVEKPIDLAHLLLGKNSIAIDTLTAKGCIAHQAPISVPLEQALPLVVLYSTAWFDGQGVVRFYDDVYNRLPTAKINSKSFASLRVQN